MDLTQIRPGQSAEEYQQNLEAVARQVTDSVPNLREDKRFADYEEARGSGAAREIAVLRYCESTSPNDLPRAEILQWSGIKGFSTKTVYVIGHDIQSSGKDERVFYSDEWFEDFGRRESEGVNFLSLHQLRIIEFQED